MNKRGQDAGVSDGARGEILWQPPAFAQEPTAAGRFLRERGFSGYAELQRWSVEDLDGFWAAATEFLGVRWHDRPTAIRDGDAMPGVRWFPGGTLNFAEHALRPRARGSDVAVIARSQTRAGSELTWTDLERAVAAAAAGLRDLGVGRGDRVVAYAPNIPETLVAFLATASLGAIWSSCAPEFGVTSVVDRLAQIEPAVLVAVDGYRYGAKDVDRTAEVAAVVAALPTLRHVVAVDYLPGAGPLDGCPASTSSRGTTSSPPRPARRRSSPSRPTTRSTSSSARARPGCRRRSSTAMGASSPSTSSSCRCTRTSAPTTSSSGSPPPAG